MLNRTKTQIYTWISLCIHGAFSGCLLVNLPSRSPGNLSVHLYNPYVAPPNHSTMVSRINR